MVEREQDQPQQEQGSSATNQELSEAVQVEFDSFVQELNESTSLTEKAKTLAHMQERRLWWKEQFNTETDEKQS